MDTIYTFYKNGEQYIKYKNIVLKCLNPNKVSSLLKEAYNPKNTEMINQDYLFNELLKYTDRNSISASNIFVKKDNDLSDTFIQSQQITLDDAKELRKNLEQTLELTEEDIKEIRSLKTSPQAGLTDLSVILYIISILVSVISLIILKAYM